jgi:hypothetical protein
MGFGEHGFEDDLGAQLKASPRELLQPHVNDTTTSSSVGNLGAGVRWRMEFESSLGPTKPFPKRHERRANPLLHARLAVTAGDSA